MRQNGCRAGEPPGGAALGVEFSEAADWLRGPVCVSAFRGPALPRTAADEASPRNRAFLAAGG